MEGTISGASRNPGELLRQGMAYHQAGRMLEAEQAYRDVLKLQPTHFDALHLLGIVYAQRGNCQGALQFLDQAVRIDPKSAPALFNRGNALQELGRDDEALASFDSAISVKADYVQAFNSRGNSMLKLGRARDALASYDKAVALAADFAGAHSNRGNALQGLERYGEAVGAYDKAIALQPNFAEAHNNRANALQALGRYDEAVAGYDRAISLRANYAEAFNSRGLAMHELGRYDDALASFAVAASVDPFHAEALNNRGRTLHFLKRYDEALTAYDKAVSIRLTYAEAWNNRGLVLHDLGRYADALVSYDKAVKVKPGFAKAYNNRGNAFFELGRYDEARTAYDTAISIDTAYPDAFNNRGNVAQRLERFDEALADYDRALALRPDYAEALNNSGAALQELGRHVDALAAHDRAIALNRNFPVAHNNRGNTLQKLQRYEEALDGYDAAIAAKPDFAEALNNRGNALQALQRYGDALVCYDRAIEAKPDYAEAFNNRGNAFQGLRRSGEALDDYDVAAGLSPNDPKIFYNRASLLGRLDRPVDAIADLERALAMDSSLPYALGDLVHYRMTIGKWDGLPDQWAQIRADIDAGRHVCSPFVALSLPLTPAEQMKCAQVYATDKMPVSPPLWRGEHAPHDRVRLAYVSADFHAHATAYLMAELFERHDRTKFELYAVSLKGSDGSAMRVRLEDAFDHFVDATRGTDREIAATMRDLEIDIAIDLKGYTENSRPEIFAYRPAPVQVSYLGYAGTMGADFIDYIVADPVVITPRSRSYFTEAVATLPGAYQVNDSRRAIADWTPTRSEAGLPDGGIVFCCFNNSYKITPEIFDIWMELLRGVDGSVLWLFAANPIMPENLRREAEARGVSGNRLVFARNIPVADHLARLRLADLVLDTMPYNAHTTASDALWAGVPLLTCSGEAFPSRVAESLLTAIGLPELVTRSLEEYRETALRLARDPAALGVLRAKLSANRPSSTLFDAARFARHIEVAYLTMWKRHLSGAPPEDFAVAPVPA